MSKKIIILLSLAAVLIVILTGAASAADSVGVIDSRKIYFQHPNFDEVTRMLLYLSRTLAPNQLDIADKQEDESTRMLLRKYGDLLLEFIALDRDITAEKDAGKKNNLVVARQTRLNQVELDLMAPINQDCRSALQAVMTDKNITAAVEVNTVYYGGTDITEDVIMQLRTNLME